MRNDLTRGLTAAIEGFFSTAWFGWGQSGPEPPGWLRVALIAGSVLGILVGLSGVRIAIQARRAGDQSALADDAARRRYLIIVGLEFGLLALGAVVLAIAGAADWIPVLVAAGVGIHFIPLAGVFHDPQLVPIGILIVVVAAVAAVVALTTDVVPAKVTGPGAGLCLLIGGALALAGQRTGGARR